jgi:hypothetical protein
LGVQFRFLFFVFVVGFLFLFVGVGLLPFGVDFRSFTGFANVPLGGVLFGVLSLPFFQGEGLGFVIDSSQVVVVGVFVIGCCFRVGCSWFGGIRFVG